MTLCLRNRQRVCPLDLRLFRRIVRSVLQEWHHPQEASVDDCEMCFHFVETKEMAKINERFLDHIGPTDVITFDHGEAGRPLRPRPGKLHGEIFICPEVAVKQAREFRTTWQSELVRYAIHGILHLAGYDDRKPADRRRMKQEENRLLKEATRQFALERLQRAPVSECR